MKNLEAINVFAFLVGVAFVILNKYLARVARAFYIRNSDMDYGIWMFRIPFLLGGTFFIVISVLDAL